MSLTKVTQQIILLKSIHVSHAVDPRVLDFGGIELDTIIDMTYVCVSEPVAIYLSLISIDE